MHPRNLRETANVRYWAFPAGPHGGSTKSAHSGKSAVYWISMNYRHSFHAGNSADVVKHSLLIALVRALQQKPGALTLIDTHAGCGLYDLGGEQAQRTGEAAHGVLRAFADPNPLLDDYRAAVRAVNVGAEPRLYPGSPQVLAQLLRPQDVLILNEKHPEDAQALRARDARYAGCRA